MVDIHASYRGTNVVILDRKSRLHSGDTKQGRLLIVDDNLMGRESYTELLRDRGYTVEQASNGEKSLELIQTHRDRRCHDADNEQARTPPAPHCMAPDVTTTLVNGRPTRLEELVEDDPYFRSGEAGILYKPAQPVKLIAEVDKRMAGAN
jgi:hypothetical protein